MKVVLYSVAPPELTKTIRGILSILTCGEQVEVHGSIEGLMQRLSLNTSDISILLILVHEKQALSDLLQIRNHIVGHRIILVLPDQEPDILSKAHLLYPRFITYTDSNFEDLKAVLEKMIHYVTLNSKLNDLPRNQIA